MPCFCLKKFLLVQKLWIVYLFRHVGRSPNFYYNPAKWPQTEKRHLSQHHKVFRTPTERNANVEGCGRVINWEKDWQNLRNGQISATRLCSWSHHYKKPLQITKLDFIRETSRLNLFADLKYKIVQMQNLIKLWRTYDNVIFPIATHLSNLSILKNLL